MVVLESVQFPQLVALADLETSPILFQYPFSLSLTVNLQKYKNKFLKMQSLLKTEYTDCRGLKLSVIWMLDGHPNDRNVIWMLDGHLRWTWLRGSPGAGAGEEVVEL